MRASMSRWCRWRKCRRRISGPGTRRSTRLLTDRAHYEALSRASRRAALAYAARLSVEPFEALLEQCPATPPVERALRRPEHRAESALDRLSPDRRKLLALRLAQNVGNLVPGADAYRPVRCGSSAFRMPAAARPAFQGWARPPAAIGCGAAGTRRRDGSDLAGTGGGTWRGHRNPTPDEPFAFFGHSMGAAVAFELARLLRRRDQPLPRMLLVSGARAPQFRRGHVPPPEPA